jgi:hypothetical protein
MKRAGFSVELMGFNVQQTVQKLSGAVHTSFQPTPAKVRLIGDLGWSRPEGI